MKTLFFLFSFVIFILCANFVNSLSISPAIIDLDLKIGIEQCKNIRVANNNTINIRGYDKWTNIVEDKRNLQKYNNTASNFGITISYKNYIENLQEEIIEVCIQGAMNGSYFGALIYQMETSGSVSAGVGAWLFVNISEKTEEAPSPQTSSSNSGGSGGGGSGSAKISLNKSSNIDLLNTSDKKEDKKEKMAEELNVDLSSEENELDVAEEVVNGDYSEDKRGISWIVWAILAVVIVISVMVINRRR